jgi:hypothetical protein
MAWATRADRDLGCGLPLMKTACFDMRPSVLSFWMFFLEVAVQGHVQALVDVDVDLALVRVARPVHIFAE